LSVDKNNNDNESDDNKSISNQNAKPPNQFKKQYDVQINCNDKKNSFSTILSTSPMGFPNIHSLKCAIMGIAHNYNITNFDFYYKKSINTQRFIIDKEEIFARIPWNEEKMCFLILQKDKRSVPQKRKKNGKGTRKKYK